MLKAELAQLKRLIYGARSERFVPAADGQLPLGLEAEATPEPPAAEEQIRYTRRKPQGKKPVRVALPAHLPRTEEVIEPEGLSEGSEKLGEEVTELLEYEPGRLYVRRIVRPRYAVGGGVVIGELPTLPIPRGNAGPGLLAQLPSANTSITCPSTARHSSSSARASSWLSRR